MMEVAAKALSGVGIAGGDVIIHLATDGGSVFVAMPIAEAERLARVLSATH